MRCLAATALWARRLQGLFAWAHSAASRVQALLMILVSVCLQNLIDLGLVLSAIYYCSSDSAAASTILQARLPPCDSSCVAYAATDGTDTRTHCANQSAPVDH